MDFTDPNQFVAQNSMRRTVKIEKLSPMGSPQPPVKRSLMEASPRRLAEMVPSSRLNINDRVRDIVTVFPQSELAEPEKLVFRRCEPKISQRVFTTKVAAGEGSSKEIHFLGTEEKPGDGFEYVLVEVNNATGKAEKFRRAALINFQPQFGGPVGQSSTTEKFTKKVDYSANFASTPEQKQAERRRLTADFGSVKKNKQLDAYIRRSVTNETLETMTSTAFSSANIITKDEADEKGDYKKISLLQQASSSVLPLPNLNAHLPGEVYKLDQFMPEVQSEVSQELQQEALQFFRQNENIQQIVNLGFAPIVVKRVGNPLRFGNPGRRCFLSLKAIVFSKLVETINTVKKGARIRNISPGEIKELGNFVPPIMFKFIRDSYLGPSRRSGRSLCYDLSEEQRNRILAELLCLLLLFDDPDYIVPISPLVQELGVTENALKILLVAMGCIVTVATEAQALTLNTIRVARLIGPPGNKSSQHSLAGRRKVRQLTRRSN